MPACVYPSAILQNCPSPLTSLQLILQLPVSVIHTPRASSFFLSCSSPFTCLQLVQCKNKSELHTQQVKAAARNRRLAGPHGMVCVPCGCPCVCPCHPRHTAQVAAGTTRAAARTHRAGAHTATHTACLSMHCTRLHGFLQPHCRPATLDVSEGACYIPGHTRIVSKLNISSIITAGQSQLRAVPPQPVAARRLRGACQVAGRGPTRAGGSGSKRPRARFGLLPSWASGATGLRRQSAQAARRRDREGRNRSEWWAGRRLTDRKKSPAPQV